MILISLQGSYLKRGPRISKYRDYSKFNTIDFRQDINNTINKLVSEMNFNSMNTAFIEVFDQHAPSQKKYIRAEDDNFITKDRRKAIMHQSKLKNNYSRNKTDDNWRKYKQQDKTALLSASRPEVSKLRPAK